MRLKFFLPGLIILFLGIATKIVFADSINSVVSGTSNHTIYKTGRNINITGVVNGDVFCLGQTVDINATVNGDVICAAQNINLNGIVNGNVRIAGQTINIEAKVSRNASIAAQDLTLASNSVVAGDLGIVAQGAVIDGNVSRDVNARVNNITFNNLIGRNVDIVAHDINLSNNSKINGNFTYTSINNVNKEAGSSVLGVINHKPEPIHHKNRLSIIPFKIYLLFATLTTGLILVALFPQIFVKWNNVAKNKIWHVLLTGLLAMIVVPIAIVILFATVIGIPLAIILLLLWFISLILSGPLASYYTGHLVAKNIEKAPLIILIGTLVLGIIFLIPILGGIIILVATWFGIGTILLNLKKLYLKPDYSTKLK